jgi:cytochrome b involved in lipid metabolism
MKLFLKIISQIVYINFIIIASTTAYFALKPSPPVNQSLSSITVSPTITPQIATPTLVPTAAPKKVAVPQNADPFSFIANNSSDNAPLASTTSTQNATTTTSVSSGNPVPTSPPAAAPTQAPVAATPMSQLSSHSTPSDCWMAISGNVYNVSAFLSAHPGGAPIMIPYCGKDATAAYNNKGGSGNSHSSAATAMLAQYLVQ